MSRLLILLFIASSTASAQQLIFPDSVNWSQLKEGQVLSFRVKVKDPEAPKFSLEGINGYGILFDTLGNFSWRPSFDLVDRLEKQKEINLIFQADWKDGRKVRTPVNFIVFHQNRPPEIGDLPVFYVKQSTQNRYQISFDYVKDPDGDPLVFKIAQAQLPEGMTLSASGMLTWIPSRNQFNGLKNTPATIEFTAQDQPDKAEAVGKIRLMQTQLDLPPEILLVPSDSALNIKENERVNFKLYVSDPNGDEDIANVSFLSSDERVPKTALNENSKVQYEFTWAPGYAFTDDAEKTKNVDIIFYAIDRSNNRSQRKVKVKINDTENIEQRDKFLYQKYSSVLMQAKALIDLLNEKHKKLEKDYHKAKKGKKNRSIFGASLGAGSAMSSAFVTSADGLKAVTAIGGSATATLGTLEATEVVGKSKNDILELIRTETEIRNQLQLQGDIFARTYALKANRRSVDFDNDRDKLLPYINNQKLPMLELDASKPLNMHIDAKEMKKTFTDYSEE
ncbi:MAG TPA: Ig-like domain-containing protein [Cyclobacteriaceae bacterium]|jgi:hypothetical protein|nr:Ig-like domain-containing protein [Cyclobacteriaceae bacterium]